MQLKRWHFIVPQAAFGACSEAISLLFQKRLATGPQERVILGKLHKRGWHFLLATFFPLRCLRLECHLNLLLDQISFTLLLA